MTDQPEKRKAGRPVGSCLPDHLKKHKITIAFSSWALDWLRKQRGSYRLTIERLIKQEIKKNKPF